MDWLISFINHGILPFVGRQAELERLTAFWRLTPQASRCRVALLTGQAGIGKSYLTEQLIAVAVADNGAAIHTKLRPGATASVVPMIAQGISRTAVARQLLKSDPDPSVASVTAALQRICHLRPTLLVIEDIHLLEGETVAEFTNLLSAIADDTISVLCTARPVELGLRGTLEGYLVEEIALGGLDTPDATNLCQLLFSADDRHTAQLTASLMGATLGNPLAVRSALRGAIASGAIALDPISGRWTARQTGDALTVTLRNNVRMLSEGMAAHLTRHERQAAGQLACLGEVFAAETAAALLPGGRGMVDELLFKGIVVPSTTPVQAITQNQSASYPLAFTHSLVHRYFLESATVQPAELVRLFAAGLPMYSFEPVTLLEQHLADIRAEPETLRKAVLALLIIARLRVYTPDWSLDEPVCRCAERIIEKFTAVWEPQVVVVLRGKLLQQQYYATFTDYAHGKERARKIIEQFVKVTGGLESQEIAQLNMLALGSQYFVNPENPAAQEATLRAFEQLVRRFPDIRFTQGYIVFLANVAASAHNYLHEDVMHWVEDQARQALAMPGATADFTQMLWEYLARHIASVFASEAELKEHIALLQNVYDTTSDIRTRLLTIAALIPLLNESGLYRRVIESGRAAIPVLYQRNLHQHTVMVYLELAMAYALAGADTTTLEKLAAECYREVRDDLKPSAADSLVAEFYRVANLCGLVPWCNRVISPLYGFGPDTASWETYLAVLAGQDDTPSEDLRAAIGKIPDRVLQRLKPVQALARAAAAAAPDPVAIQTAAVAILEAPVYSLTGIQNLCCCIDLLARLAPDAHSAVESHIEPALAGAMDWLAARGLPAPMESILTRYGDTYLKPKDAGRWKTRAAHCRKECAAALPEQAAEPEPDNRVRITMLDTVNVMLPDVTGLKKISGARQRTLLGVLVADAMTGYKIEHRDFCQMVSGGEDDPEYARKYMNNAVKRLREVVGPEAINTDVRVPQLDLDHVSVDLIDAWRLMGSAAAAHSANQLAKAAADMLAALKLTGAKVPFPSLYEEYFETLRDQITVTVHNTTVRIARTLLKEGDAQKAEELLEPAFAAYPDDEDVAELLESACRLLGKGFESGLVRRKSEAAMG